MTLSYFTRSIDPNTAPLSELEAAYQDCADCIGSEYPETWESCGTALKICDRIDDALRARFPEIKWDCDKRVLRLEGIET